ncbi:hypothetical protein [Edaphobacter modestus]|uniref:Uncharacterized protein n=1 Tax=Edaphobacter modestus TaxID=388466 RepID=A0A4Q7YRC0_9BACT|nr:hypothetical protein [Edaphobacter modestus]RZU40332.1 hypothetical protein BDD14_1781 [Edaphobacter modestus]
MSTTAPKRIEIDSSEAPASKKKILAEGEAQTLDSSTCWVTNDTNTTYIVYMLHDNGFIDQIWGQPPGMTVGIPPTWKVKIWPCNGDDFYWGDTDGHYSYTAIAGLTTRAGSFNFSQMS